jgi:phage-related minor tail protein
MSSPPTLAQVLTDILNAITTVIDNIATTIADNASAVATVLVVGGLILGVMALWRRFGPAVTGFFRSLF